MGSTSPLRSRSAALSVPHGSHTKPRWLLEQACGCVPREPGASGPHRAWPACRPCSHSPRVVRTGSLRAELTLFLADRRERDTAASRRGCARWRPNWRRTRSPWRQWICDPRYRILGDVTLEILGGTPGSGSGRGSHLENVHMWPELKGLVRWTQPRTYGHVTPGLGWEMGVNLETVAM